MDTKKQAQILEEDDNASLMDDGKPLVHTDHKNVLYMKNTKKSKAQLI
mgnify:CR=1 FL=1